MRPALAAAWALALTAPLASAAGPDQGLPAPLERPHIIVIETADQTVDTLRVMPNVRRLVVGQGASFDGAVVALPAESPSAATFLTGRYGHRAGVVDDQPPGGGYGKLDAGDTLPVWLQRAGYYTAHVGPYLNGYGRRDPTEVPPGWSDWHAPVGASMHRYLGYTLNENGRLVRYRNGPDAYQTDVLAASAARIVARRAGTSQPLFLWVSFLAPRAGLPAAGRPPETPLPAPRHQGRFSSEALPLSPSFNEADVADKPLAVRERPLLGAGDVARLTQAYRLRLESLAAVDEGVAAIVGAVAGSGALDRTWIVFTSRTGFLSGQHRLPRGKAQPYEPAVRVPLLVRGPGVAPGLRLPQPVSRVDLAPTVLDMAGLPVEGRLDGRSLLPLLRDPGLRFGRDLLIEGPGRDPASPAFAALRTSRYVYVERASGERELYDLSRDPDQLTSRHADPALAAVRDELARRLERLRRCAGSSCRVGPALSLSARVQGSCPRLLVQASLAGADAGWVRRVTFLVGERRVAVDGRPPFRVLTRLPAEATSVRVHAVLADGREVTRDRRLTGCSG